MMQSSLFAHSLRNVSIIGFILITMIAPSAANADYDACVVDLYPYLNVRNDKYPDSSVIDKLYSRTKVRVNTHASTGYRKIHVPVSGWVSGSYLDRSYKYENTSNFYSAKVSTSGGNLNARSRPGICFPVITSLTNEQHLDVFTHTTSVPWALVGFTKSNGQYQYAYVHRSYISKQ